MLILIGLGLNDEKDVSLKGLELAKNADKVFMELYTGVWHGKLDKFKKMINKPIEILERNELEENSQKVLKLAQSKNVVLLVQGDPLVATTHSSLVLDARKLGIKIQVIHNASIVSAVMETGLHLYKFGPPVTVPFPEKTKGMLPESVYDHIKENKQRNLHTLCLLDVDAEKEKFMVPGQALEILLEIEAKRKENVLTKDSEVVIFSKAGSDDQQIRFLPVKSAVSDIDTSDFPAVVVIPGKLHFTEKELLSIVR